MVRIWPNRDPIGEQGGPNLYAFVRNDPTDRNDPYGLLDENRSPIAVIGPAPGGGGTPAPIYGSPRPEPVLGGRPIADPDCVRRCMQQSGAGWALGALGLGTLVGGTVPSPFPKGMGSKNPWTTVPSIIELGIEKCIKNLGNLIRGPATKLNPFMTGVQVGAAGVLAGMYATCFSMCTGNSDAF